MVPVFLPVRRVRVSSVTSLNVEIILKDTECGTHVFLTDSCVKQAVTIHSERKDVVRVGEFVISWLTIVSNGDGSRVFCADDVTMYARPGWVSRKSAEKLSKGMDDQT